MAILSGTLASATNSPSKAFMLKSDVSLSGTWVGTVLLQRSFDDGTTWVTVGSFTANTEFLHENNSSNIIYRFNCTAYTSGTIVFRMSN
jgi:hypothetical protein